MKRLILLVSLLLSLHAEEGIKKVVFDLTTGDPKRFEQNVLSGIVKNKNHYENNFQELNVAVVIHGESYKFFIKDLSTTRYGKDRSLLSVHSEFAKRLQSLTDNYHVKFYMCQAGMNHLKVMKEDIYDFVTIVPTSTIGLIDKQSEGYTYVPIR